MKKLHLNNPQFSIIIPTLNEEKYLPGLLTDLAAQSFRDFEVVVADGHSNDQTVTYAKSLSKSLPALKIINSVKRHVCVQRNLGAKYAKGTILIFMDSDNRLPFYFLQGIKYRLEESGAEIATCWLKSDNNTTKENSIAQALNYSMEILKSSSNYQFLESLIIVDHESFHKIGGFNENANFGEGAIMGKGVKKLGLKYSIFRDPVYDYSFRRIRKYGALNLANLMARHELAVLFNLPTWKVRNKLEYPMKGGILYDTPLKRRQRFGKRIQTLLLDLRSPQKLKRKLNKNQ